MPDVKIGQKVNYSIDDEGLVGGTGVHDGYLYGVVQTGDALLIYAEAADGSKREIKLLGITQMNVTDFWIGSIIGDVWLWPRERTPKRMWEELFKGRLAINNGEASLRSSIENASGRHFFALESSYGANVYAVCESLEITAPG